MPVSNSPELLSVDVEAMEQAVRETVDGSVRSFVEFDEDEFHVVFVDDVSLSFYDDEDQMTEHFEEIHSYVHLDFMEMGFYTEDIFPIANRVRYIASGLDIFTVVRIYFGDEGLFVALDSGESVEPVVEAVEEVYEA
jgi:DNA-dependent RNA polymerase auxiliary subunit epsilon